MLQNNNRRTSASGGWYRGMVRSAWSRGVGRGGGAPASLGGGQVALLHAVPVDQVVHKAAQGRGRRGMLAKTAA